MRRILLLLAGLFLLAAPAVAQNVIDFEGRKIDLDLHLQGYPYSSPFVDLRAGKLFYKKRGKTEQMMMAPLGAGRGRVDLSHGRVVSGRDFAARTWWGSVFNPVLQRIILLADDRNDEITNLYALDPDTGQEEQLTHTSYIYGWMPSPDERRLAYVSRATKDEMSRSDLRVLELATRTERVVYEDSPARKIVWTQVVWQPSGKGLLVGFTAHGDRARRNLLYVPLDGSAPRVLTDESKQRYELNPIDPWLSETEYLYTSDESGQTSVYRGSLDPARAPERASAAGVNVKDAALLEKDERKQLLTVSGNPLKSTLALADARTGALLAQRELDGQWQIEDSLGSRAVLSHSSLSVPFEDVELRSGPRSFELLPRVAWPKPLLDRVLQCKVEKVSFPTFDGLSAPGEKGNLHAYLLVPRKPRPRAELRGLVLSFYGGANTFWSAAEVLCDAGYYVLSPAPRGSEDFGTAFYDLAAGDWGGAETLDGFAAGKYLQQRLGIPAARIGIFGHSRGGYDTLRALTFPGSVNGIQEDFRFGFGIAQSGVGNIIRAAQGGNISQWYHNLTGGDPADDRAKWLDRSPETHAALLSGPVLLVHGSQDMRIPVTESRSMYEALKRAGKPATYVELEGQGHSYKGVPALTQYYRAVFEFLSTLP